MELPKRDLDIIEITKTFETPGYKFIIAYLNKEVEQENTAISNLTSSPVKDDNKELLNLHIAIRNKLEVMRDNFEDEVFKVVDETDLKFTVNRAVHNTRLLEINL